MSSTAEEMRESVRRHGQDEHPEFEEAVVVYYDGDGQMVGHDVIRLAESDLASAESL